MTRAFEFEGAFAVSRRGARQVLAGILAVDAPIVFLPYFTATLGTADGRVFESSTQTVARPPWLPRGRYRVELALPGALHPCDFTATLRAFHRHAMADVEGAAVEGPYRAGAQEASAAEPMRWTIEAVPPTAPLTALAWNRGREHWFQNHFDYAATTTITVLLGNHPALRGRILDIGCGDGITDLGIALRTRCEELVGIDPFKGFERLPQILRGNGFGDDVIPANLRFVPADANHLPFRDDSFDVVVSWGSIEHIAGGYLRALAEAKRVLKHGGLVMVHPGLYYSNIGHHLGEFSSEPFFHLKKPREEIRRMVLETPPRYIDRAGEFSSSEQYWQWFTELNPITVAGFEREMRELGFRPWRVMLRPESVIEYTPEIEAYPMQDLATNELYTSWVNNKR